MIVKDGKVVGEGYNSVLATNDPTAHAEMVAIREACKNMDSFLLEVCEVYTSCEPCPMCLGAIYWARPDKVFYACSQSDAAKAGFDDQFIYEELDTLPANRKIPSSKFYRIPEGNRLKNGRKRNVGHSIEKFEQEVLIGFCIRKRRRSRFFNIS